MSLTHACRFCQRSLNTTFIDLGNSPLSNAYLIEEDLYKKEPFYPLHAKVCNVCFLVQLPEFEAPENIFKDYAYFSSYSESWLQHASDYTDMMMERFSIDSNWKVIEIASNDGYLLQYFKEKNVSVLGIEPAENVAEVARNKNIPTLSRFFGKKTAELLREEGTQADLLIGNNVLAHVPNLHDFVSGLKIILSPRGILTMEFPHLMQLIMGNQFDTIYHEHFSYFSLLTVQQIFHQHDLCIFDVEEIPVHGGSLRVFIKHNQDHSKAVSDHVENLLLEEKTFKLDDIETYQNFTDKVNEIKNALIDFVLKAKKENKTIVGYGAPAKGNTLLNYCGINSELMSFTVDKNPYKQNRFLPGTRIPVFEPEKIYQFKPDYILVLPWNIKTEIINQMEKIKEWGGKFIVPIPALEVI